MVTTDEPATGTEPAPDRPIFLDPHGRRRMWLRLTSGVTAGSGVVAVAMCAVLLSDRPSPGPATFALSPEYAMAPGIMDRDSPLDGPHRDVLGTHPLHTDESPWPRSRPEATAPAPGRAEPRPVVAAPSPLAAVLPPEQGDVELVAVRPGSASVGDTATEDGAGTQDGAGSEGEAPSNETAAAEHETTAAEHDPAGEQHEAAGALHETDRAPHEAAGEQHETDPAPHEADAETPAPDTFPGALAEAAPEAVRDTIAEFGLAHPGPGQSAAEEPAVAGGDAATLSERIGERLLAALLSLGR